MMHIKQKGDFSRTLSYMTKIKKAVDLSGLEKYAEEGVRALAAATPRKTGKTAESWSYRIERRDGFVTIEFLNSNIQNGVPVAVILYYGHGTRNGGYVDGIDYINPAICPVFEKIKNEAWKEIKEA